MGSTCVHINAVGAVMGGAARHLGPFVHTLTTLRPDWSLVVHISRGAVHDFPPGVEVHAVARDYPRRMAWDSHLVGRAASRSGAVALVNLANYGPFRSPVPSALFQWNPIYFDPSWVRRMGRSARLDAAARRSLAYAEMRGAAAVVTPSHAMAAYLRSWRGFPRGTRIRVIPCAVDTRRFRFERRDRRDPSGPRLRLLSVSHAAPHKGQELLIDLVAELARRHVDAELSLTVAHADAPAYVAGLESRARALGVTDRIKLLGRTSDVERLYWQADVFVLPSFTESFGFPVVEAMATGVPTVASAIPSTVELLADAGWYFEPGDVVDAADQVLACIAAPADERRARLEHGRTRAEAFSWTRHVTGFATLIEEIGGLAPGRAGGLVDLGPPAPAPASSPGRL